ncbi:MAG: AAA family ATPase [Bacteroidota bacterium]
MNFVRHILPALEAWQVSNGRKPLILRGARQVGKTTLIADFAKRYDHSILLNLEKPAHRAYFDDLGEVKTITEALFLSNKIPAEALGKTLLFIDEIQESPRAIQLLRYFYEDIPALHVIAAGSLLEFAMRKVQSFPVGRVEYLHLHPLNFPEYLQAIGHEAALHQLEQIPIKPFAHQTLLNLFHRYAITGGMPEVVQRDVEKNSLSDLPKVYESIWETYKNDVEKYTRNDTERKVIKHVMDTAPLYVDQRIKFQGFGNSNYRSREVGEAMRTLEDARIIRLIYPTVDMEPPIRPDLKKSPRLQLLDTGLINHALGIQSEMLRLKDFNAAHKGAIIPHLITQELISLSATANHKPNFWVREKTQSNAEVDLVFVHKGMVIPVEVKSGSAGALKSLHQFVEASNHPYAVRIYGGEFVVSKTVSPKGKPYILMNMPYYLGAKLPAYIQWFVESNTYNL